MSYNEFIKYVTKNGKYSQEGRIIELEVKNKYIKLENLIQNIAQKMGLKLKDYNVGDNNCQDFIAPLIESLDAVRNEDKREYHIKSKLHIPPTTLEKMEKNEIKDKKAKARDRCIERLSRLHYSCTNCYCDENGEMH